MENQSDLLAESGAATLADHQWDEARRRAVVIGPLAELIERITADGGGGRPATRTPQPERSTRLFAFGGNPAAVCRLWRRRKPNGGKGKARLDGVIEAVIDEAIERFYLTAQKPRISALVKEIRRRCRLEELKPPALNTVKARLSQLRPDKALAKREGSKAAHRLKPAPGVTPEARIPLNIVQMDHTKIDVIVVDPVSRLPIGRPFLTIAIDGFSRCIVGICITLDPPSATSVGLCLTHAAMEKRPWLERLGVDCVADAGQTQQDLCRQWPRLP